MTDSLLMKYFVGALDLFRGADPEQSVGLIERAPGLLTAAQPHGARVLTHQQLHVIPHHGFLTSHSAELSLYLKNAAKKNL